MQEKTLQKRLLLIFFIFFITWSLYAKEMDLYKNYDGDEEFSTLTLEEQYTSYINSFAHRTFVLEQPMNWALRMIDQYGREILPYLNNSIINFSFDIRKKNFLFLCIDYVIYELKQYELLTPSELQLYQMIFASKLETYVAKHKIIDEIVIDNFGYLTYDTFIKDENTIFPPSITPESLKEYYEAKLGISVEIAEELK